ncbi:MAG TPA: oligosaccharide flippase family protein [Candidatus Eisenbacteria bacterium]|nr:oligosaccharide flippase family protein [Candidatus Eisenbacteria bacterium]
MNLKREAVKNVSATWICLLVHAAVSFLLSPFVLHRLGDAAFGIWVLIFSLTGYFGLLDLGIRSSIVRFVANAAANRNDDQLQRLFVTSLYFYCGVAIIVLVLTGIGYYYLPELFKVPISLMAPARILLLLVGISVAFTFPLSLSAGVLEGLQKFARVQVTQCAFTVLRGAAVAVALISGGGLLTVGFITVGANLGGYVLLMCMAHSRFPLSAKMNLVDMKILRKMMGHGAFAFIIILAEKLRFQSDALLIGAYLSATAIVVYAVSSRLVEYSTYAIRSMAQIFTPLASQFHAAGEEQQLRRVVLVGNRACALIVFPLVTAFVVLGRSIIEVWVGSRYVSGYFVLVLLIVPRGLYLAQSASTRVLLGTGRHQMMAWVLLFEGMLNVLLSLALLPRFGILGVAVGTAVPLACTSLIFLPWHVSHKLGVPLSRLITSTFLSPIALCIPLIAVLWYLTYSFPAHHYASLIAELSIGAAVYVATLAISLVLAAPGGKFWIREIRHLLEPQYEYR